VFCLVDVTADLPTPITRKSGGFEKQAQKNLGRVVRKPVNANPGLKVNRGISFSCIKVLSTAYVL